jgi:hypothetical protein
MPLMRDQAYDHSAEYEPEQITGSRSDEYGETAVATKQREPYKRQREQQQDRKGSKPRTQNRTCQHHGEGLHGHGNRAHRYANEAEGRKQCGENRYACQISVLETTGIHTLLFLLSVLTQPDMHREDVHDHDFGCLISTILEVPRPALFVNSYKMPLPDL